MVRAIRNLGVRHVTHKGRTALPRLPPPTGAGLRRVCTADIFSRPQPGERAGQRSAIERLGKQRAVRNRLFVEIVIVIGRHVEDGMRGRMRRKGAGDRVQQVRLALTRTAMDEQRGETRGRFASHRLRG